MIASTARRNRRRGASRGASGACVPRALVALAALAGLAACSRTPPPPPTPALLPPEACPVESGTARPGASLVVALTEPVAPAHAPVPRGEAEAVVFRTLYETLVDVDCRGALAAGLARAWTCSDDRRLWTFTLHADAEFWDGTAVSAEAVRDCWLARRRALRREGRLTGLWEDVRPRTVAVLDEHRLVLSLPEARPDLPYLLAHPAFAVTRAASGAAAGGWPVGTGTLGVPRGAAVAPAPAGGELEVERTSGSVAARSGPRRVTFRIRPGADPRDLLAEGADAVLVRERAILSYLERATGNAGFALPWSRLHLLLLPGPVAGASRLARERAALARDVTLAEARAWDALHLDPLEVPGAGDTRLGEALCAAGRVVVPDPELSDRILCPAADPDARRLAERLAFLLGTEAEAAPRLVTPLAADAFAEAVRRGSGAAIVFPLGRSTATARLQTLELLHAAPWLTRAIGADPDDGIARVARLLAGSERVVPLVATRSQLVTRSGLAGIRCGHEGVPRLRAAGWSATEALP